MTLYDEAVKIAMMAASKAVVDNVSKTSPIFSRLRDQATYERCFTYGAGSQVHLLSLYDYARAIGVDPRDIPHKLDDGDDPAEKLDLTSY